jgi:Na+-translocating ferredoxin:NAD+ oxidoreductase RNF subunit RnfB
MGLGKKVGVFSTEPVVFKEIKNSGVDTMNQLTFRSDGSKSDAYILCNPGGEETWDRFYTTLTSGPNSNSNKAPPLVILNNAYSTTYDLGNKRGYEEGKRRKESLCGYYPKDAFVCSGKSWHVHVDSICHCVTICLLPCSSLCFVTWRFVSVVSSSSRSLALLSFQ